MKAVSLILRILALLGAIAAIVLWAMIDGKLAEKVDELATAQAETSTLEEDLAKATDRISGLEAQVQRIEEERESIGNRLANATDQLGEAQSEIARLQREKRQLEQDVAAKDDRIESMEKELLQDLTAGPAPAVGSGAAASGVAAEEVAKLEQDLSEARSRNDRLSRRIDDLEEDLDAAREDLAAARIAQTRAPVAASNPLAGADAIAAGNFKVTDQRAPVLKVSGDDGMVLIGTGANDGILPNQPMAISRSGGEPIFVRVQSVMPEFSLANILPGQAGFDSIRVGDEAVVLVQR